MKTNNKTLSVFSGLICLFGLTTNRVNAQTANFTNLGNHGNSGRIVSLINSTRPNGHLNINPANINLNSIEPGNGLLNGNLTTSNIANINQQQINLIGINSYQSLSNISKGNFNANNMQTANNLARPNQTHSTPASNLTEIISNLPTNDWTESSKDNPIGELSENVSNGSLNLSDMLVTSNTDNGQSSQRCDHADFSIVKSRSAQRCDHADFSIIKSQPNARCDHADFSIVANH